MSRTIHFGLLVRPRLYQCTVCGHKQMASTNHTDNCLAYCEACSWKPSYGPGIAMFEGRTYRAMQFIGTPPSTDEFNTHSTHTTAERDDDLVTAFRQD